MSPALIRIVTFAGAMLLFLMPASAQSQKTFNLGGNDVVLQDVSPTVEVYFQSMRLNRALNQWNLEIKLRNTAVRPLTGPVVVVFETVTNATGPLSPDGTDGSGKPWFDLSSRLPALGLDAGQSSQTRTLALGVTTGSPLLNVRVYAPVTAAGPALALANVVDLVGHPVVGVQIAETGPDGSGTVDADPLLGIATLGRGEGTNLFRFSAPGYLPVWRKTSLANGSVRSLPTPRLPARETNVFAVGPAASGFSNRLGTVRVTVPAGAFAAGAQAQLTALTPQTLPGLLPLGWSPLQGFWLELSQEPASPLSVRLDLLDVIKPGETAALARWNSTSQNWDVVQLVAGLGASAIVVPLAGSGAWTLVVPDTGVTAPPAAVVSQIIPASPVAAPDYAALAGVGSVDPASSPASTSPALVTAQARLMVSNSAGAIASGTLLRGEMTERYSLRDGTTRVIPPYQTYLVGYQRPGDSDVRTLHATFPMQPQLLLTPEELLLGSVFMDVLPPTSFAGGVLNTNGVSITNGFLTVTIGAGSVARVQAVQIDPLDGTNYTGFLPDGFSVASAFRLVAGGLNGQAVSVQVVGLSTNSLYVLARLRSENGAYGLEPIERLKIDGSGRLSSLEPATPPRLPGITGSGQFVLVKVPTAQVLLTGVARNAAGRAVAGLLVKRDPWMTLSGAAGAFQLISPAGAAQLLVTDLAAGDIGILPVTVPGGGPLTGLAAAAISEGPRVLSVTPSAGSTNVALVSSVEVVFSRPLNAASVLGNVRLASTLTSSVPASVTLNLKGNSITILPENPLVAGTVHTVVLSTNLADLSAQKLVGTNQFSFTTTQPNFIRTPGSQLVSYEPTNGFVKMEGSQGLVEPGKAVILVNETTGRTSTTLANVDGSFRGDILADVDDKLSITLINANGTRNSIPVSRQIYADGSVALFESGGAIETPGENGPIRFDIEPGAINGKTKFKFQSVPLTNVLTIVSNVAIEGGGRLLGGVKVSPIAGAQLSQSMDVTFPVKVADMQLPNGVSPSNCSFGLVISRIIDGEQVFELVDRMHYEDGKLVTHSPPFFGLLGPFEDILIMPLLMAVSQTMTTIHGYTFAANVDPATGLPPDLRMTNRQSLPGYLVLPNAVVTAKPYQSGVQPRGRLIPGAVYTLSGQGGSYAILVRMSGNSADRAVGVSATHPQFPGIRAESYFPQLEVADLLSIGNVLSPVNVVFPRQAVDAKTPPFMAVNQSPADAQIASNTVVTVLVTDNDSLPSLNYYIDSLYALDGSALSQSAIDITDQTDAAVGSFARRYSFTVRSPKRSVVTFRLRATDAHGNVADQPFPIGIGLVPPPATNAIPVADPNDNIGPAVVLTDPTAESRGHSVAAPVSVTFDEPIDRIVLGDPVAVAISPAAGTPRLSLSDDQSRLMIDLPSLRPDTDYTVTLGTTIRDLRGNRLAGPLRTNSQPYSFSFRTAPVALGLFPLLSTETGVGVQILGNRAFLLKRVGTGRGKLEAYKLSNPLVPTKIAEVSVPEFPRDMFVIPKYSFWWENPADSNLITNVTQVTGIRTNDLLVAVGGLTGLGTFQWIRVFDITSPETWDIDNPSITGGALGFDGLSVPSNLRWSGPALSYLETGTPDRISVLDLQSWLIGTLMQRSQAGYLSLPFAGTNGVDLNFDGDYTDAGERPPLPARGRVVDFLGKEIAVGAFETTSQIFDHVLENRGSYIGAVLGAGNLIESNGEISTNRIGGSYRTLSSSGLTLDLTNSSYFYPEGYFPRRAASLFSYPLVLSNRAERLDLVAVTVRGPGTNFVSVLDVTDRLGIRQIDAVPIEWEGNNTNIHGILVREDGLLAVATMTNLVLIDPTKFGTTWTNGSHPAVVGVLPGIGGVGRSFDSKANGLGASPDVGNYGTPPRGAPVISMGPPKLDVVNLIGVEPFAPSTLATTPATNASAKLDRAFVVDFVAPGRFRGDLVCGGITNVSTVSNLSSRVHHYVRVRAPGGAGQFIDLAAEALNEAGEPLRKRGFLFPPVHGFAATTLGQLEQTPGADDAPVRALRAWRASNNPNDPLYNVYLSRPFVVLNEELSIADLAAIKAQLDRDVFWGGHRLRFSFDPGAPTNTVTGPFVGQVLSADRRYRPGVAVTVQTFPGDYIQSPNPGPVAGGATLPLVANALNAHNGELTINATDMALPGRRMPLEFRRNYSGQGLFDGPFGRGWDFNFNQRVVPVPALALGDGEKIPLVVRTCATNSETAGTKDLIFYNGAGRATVFRHAGVVAPAEIAADPLVQQLNWIPKAAAFYLPPDGIFTPMFRFKDGRYVRLDTDGRQTWFHPNGRLARIYDRYEKNFLDLVYNRRGELTRIYDDVGRPLDIGYYRLGADAEFRAGVDETLPAAGAATRWAALGRIARLKDYSGRDVLFFYSADGLLERRLGVDIQTSGPGGFTGRSETRYDYSDSSDPTRTAKSLVAVRGNEPGGAAVAAVDGFGSSGRDVVGSMKIGGGTTKIALGHANTGSAMAAGGGTAKVISPDNAVSDMKFDSFGRMTENIMSGTGGSPATNRTEFYTNGLVKAVIQPMGGRTEFYYDDTNPSLRSRGNLVRIKKIPDSRGGPVLEARSAFSPFYNIQEGSNFDYRGTESIIVLHPDKRDTFMISKGGEKETFSLNSSGQLESHTSVDNVVTKTIFNPDGFPQYRQFGLHQSTLSYAPFGGAASDPGRRGRPSSVTDAEGITTEFVHNELDQIVAERRAGSEVVNSFDAPGNLIRKSIQVQTNRAVVQTFFFNSLGFMTSNVVSAVETFGGLSDMVTVYEPDSFRRVKAIILPSGERQEFDYDHAGRLVELRRGTAQTQRMTYDANGNLLTVTIGSGSETNVYDGHDRMVGILSANGSRLEMALDNNGNVATNSVYAADGSLVSRTARLLNDLNQEKEVQRFRDTGVASTKTFFNNAARSVTTIDAEGAQSVTSMDESGRPFLIQAPNFERSMFYDNIGNLRRTATLEGGLQFEQAMRYNGRSQLVEMTDSLGQTNRFVVDVDGRILASTDKLGRPTLRAYTLLGEQTSSLRPDGVLMTQTYGGGRQVTSMADAAGGASTFTFDPEGRLRAATLPNGALSTSGEFNQFLSPITNGLPRGISVRSSFDNEGKLTNRIYSGATFGPDRIETFAYDALRRYTTVADNQGSVGFTYDLGGFVRRQDYNYQFSVLPRPIVSLPFAVTQDTYLNDFRKELGYPDGGFKLAFERDVSGRLKKLIPTSGSAIISDTTWVGDSRIGQRLVGDGLIRVELAYDGLRRVVGRRYVRVADGSILADIRHLVDANGAILARQELHRGGRADLFGYDAGYRLTRWDSAARPSAGDGLGRTLPGFASVPGLAGSWSPGGFAKTYAYDATDRFTSNRVVNPDGLPGVAPMATNFAGTDALLFATNVNGFIRSSDAVGNITRTELAVRIPGTAAPQLVPATLSYDHLGRLVRAVRDDGVTVINEYGPLGLRIRRVVTGPVGLCVPSDIAYLYDGNNLVEERDLSNAARLVRRYFYGDEGDELLGADLDVAGTLRRHWYLTDNVRSVTALVDNTGATVERMAFDPWGQHRIELADSAPPEVSFVRLETNGLSVAFTEPVMPQPVVPLDKSALATSTAGFDGLVEITIGGVPVTGQVKLDESASPSGFGSVVRFITPTPITGTVGIRVVGGFVRDEWANTNSAFQTNLTVASGPGTVLAAPAAAFSTAPTIVGRSSVSSPMLFHGQYFDDETGLYYFRARFYDPYTASFLTRDPAGYADSANQYAAFRNSPVNFRDPNGGTTDELGAQLVTMGSQANFKEDGFTGLAVGKALTFVGSVLQLGTKTAEGLELLNSDAQGTFGLLDRMKGADLVIQDFQVAQAAYGKLSNMGNAAAGRIHGWMNALENRRMDAAANRQFLRGRGLADFEIEGFVNGMQRFKRELGAKSVEVAVRGFKGKEQARRERVEAGMAQKNTESKGKTDSNAQISRVYATEKSRTATRIGKKDFVSDTDMFYVKVDGRTLSEREVGRLRVLVGQEQSKAFRKMGNTGIPNVGVLHGAHVNMPELIGTRTLSHYDKQLGLFGPSNDPGKDLDLVKKVGSPGADAFAIRVGEGGQVRAFTPSLGRLKATLVEAQGKLWRDKGMHLPDSYLDGFENANNSAYGAIMDNINTAD